MFVDDLPIEEMAVASTLQTVGLLGAIQVYSHAILVWNRGLYYLMNLFFWGDFQPIVHA